MSNSNKEKFEKILGSFNDLSEEMGKTVESFYIWKTLYLSRSVPTVGKERAERNVQIINLYLNFFLSTEDSHLNSFIIRISKFFDRDSRNLSIQFLINEIKNNKKNFTSETLVKLYPDRFDANEIEENYLPIKEEDELTIEKLKEQYLPVIKKLKLIRDKYSAHRSAHIGIQKIDRRFTFKEVEGLINAIQEMFNTIYYSFDRSSTCWDHIKEKAIRDTDFLFDNLYKGEQQRKKLEKKWKKERKTREN